MPEDEIELQARGPSGAAEGSTPATSHEAQHWIRFYRDVITFEESVLAQMHKMAAELPADLQQEVQRSNIEPMHDLIASYRERISELEQAMISLLPDEDEPGPDEDRPGPGGPARS